MKAMLCTVLQEPCQAMEARVRKVVGAVKVGGWK